MNWRRIMLGSILCLSCLSRHGWAQQYTSLKLREDCKFTGTDYSKLSGDELIQATVCNYYVNGVFDGYRLGAGPRKGFVCIPENVMRGQLPLIVAKYLDDHPEMLQKAPDWLILDALSEAFPCKTEAKPK